MSAPSQLSCVGFAAGELGGGLGGAALAGLGLLGLVDELLRLATVARRSIA